MVRYSPGHARIAFPSALLGAAMLAASCLPAAAQPAAPQQGTPPAAGATAGPQGAPEQGRNTRLQRFCTERYARTVGRLAYLQAMLNLSTEQQALYDKWRDAAASGAAKVRDACRQAAAAPAGRPTIVERQARIGRIVSARAQALQTAQQPLEALYQSLSSEQKAMLDEEAGRMGERMRRMMGGMRGRMGEMMMERHGHHGTMGHEGRDSDRTEDRNGDGDGD